MMNPLVTTTSVFAAGGQAGSPATQLRAYDRATGALVWRVSQPSGNDVTGIATLGGRVFISTLGDHAVRAYDAVSGTLLWTFQADSAPNPPTIAYGTLFVQTIFHDLYALDPATGQTKWSTGCQCEGDGGPAVAGTRLFTANGDRDSVQAFDSRTGALLWTTLLASLALGPPTAVDGKVFVASLSLYALDQRTGAVVWEAPFGGGESAPAVANGIVYAGDDYGDLYAFRESDGKQLWRSHTQNAFVLSAPIVANGVVYAATLGAYAFDALTGQRLWRANIDHVNAAPAVVDGVFYVDDFSGTLWAFGLPADGG
jgi:outer membrane protein assembly factor BamB